MARHAHTKEEKQAGLTIAAEYIVDKESQPRTVQSTVHPMPGGSCRHSPAGPITMTPQEIANMPAGRSLDQAVHTTIMQLDGEAPAYSTDEAAALQILTRCPLFCCSIDPSRPEYSAARPYAAGRLQFEQSVKGDITVLRISAATLPLALSKAALLTALKSPIAREQKTAAKLAATIKGAAKKKAIKSMRPIVPQPTARVTTRDVRPPIPARKPFVAGQSPAV